jgi:hypothetical protein
LTTPSQSNAFADAKQFARAMLSDWLARMSGPLSVPAAIASLWVPNDTAKILLGLTAIAAFCLTAYRLWKSEHDNDQRRQQLLDDISALREKLTGYRIQMEADHHANHFDQNA